MTIRHLSAVVLSALLLFGGPAFGSSEVDRLEAQLAAQRSAIEKDRAALNADCGVVPASDTAKIASCRQQHDDVLRRMEQYKADYRRLTAMKKAAGRFSGGTMQECPPGSGKFCPAGSYCCGADRCCKYEPSPPLLTQSPPPLPSPPPQVHCPWDCLGEYQDCLKTAFSWSDATACTAAMDYCRAHCK